MFLRLTLHDKSMTLFAHFMTKKARADKWPRIYKQSNRNGDFTYYVDLRAVDGGRPGFPILADAKIRAEQARAERVNEGTLAFALPAHVRLDAAKAHQILAPHNISILEAAKYYQKHVLAYKSAPLVKDIVVDYLRECKNDNLMPRTLLDYENRLETFAADFGESRLSDITLDELKEWINDDAWEPRTRKNYLTVLSQFYNHAMPKWTDLNLAKLVKRPKMNETTPEIFTVTQAEQLLMHADEFDLLPYFAIGLFAGVRSAEIMRLDGKDINFEAGIITIGADVAKKRSRRHIKMEPALLAWLEPCREDLKNGGPVVQNHILRKNKEALLKAAKIKAWPDNGLRHSFGSYHLAMFHDAVKTAEQMGNSSDMVHKHYKVLVPESEAKKFWGLRPEAAENVVALKDKIAA
jgi:integrase/recombinase XerD